MKYSIELDYNDKCGGSQTIPNDFKLNVRASFDDEAAPFVAEIIEHFNAKFTETKNLAQKKSEEEKEKGEKENG